MGVGTGVWGVGNGDWVTGISNSSISEFFHFKV